MSSPLLLEAESSEELADLVKDALRENPGSSVVSAERIPSRGFGKWFKPERFHARVNVPEALPKPEFSTAARLGIAALLDASDAAEDSIAGRELTPSQDFDVMMAKLDDLTRPKPDAAATPEPVVELTVVDPQIIDWAEMTQLTSSPPPVPGKVHGDLIVLVGMTADVTAVAQQMSKQFGPGEARAAGTAKTRGKPNLTDRRSTLQARAEAVERQKVIFCAFGFDGVGDDIGPAVAALHPDQVWAVVDAGRKPEDSERWVRHLNATAGVTAVAAVGVSTTSTPQTVNSLGFPVGWSDGAPTSAQRF